MDFIQLRDRRVSDRRFERFLDRLAAEVPEVLPRVLVNDRLALAAAFPVAGVHLPEAGFPLAAVRAHYGDRMLQGRSVHGSAAAERSAREGADYLILGAAAPTGEKIPQPAGVFAEACRRSQAPVWAVGGLAPDNLEVLAGSGISGIAAIRSLAGPRRAAAFLRAVREAGDRGLFAAAARGSPVNSRNLP